MQSLYVKHSTVRSSGRSKASSPADTAPAKTVVQGLMDKGVQGIVKSAGAMQQLIRTR